jgi:hypothetical protein
MSSPSRLRGIGALLGAAAVAASVFAGLPAFAEPEPSATCAPDGAPSSYLCAQPDQLVDVRIGDVHPTQPSLGYDEVYYKLGRYTMGKDAINKRFGDWCEANGQGDAASASEGATLTDPTSFSCTIPVGAETAESIAPMKTVVIGPGGVLYLTDGHHTLTSFSETPDGGPDLHVRLRVLGNLSNLSQAEFVQTMIANKWMWLKDVDGNAVDPAKLPQNVGLKNFADDKYRSVMYFGRDIGYTAGSIPFQEFYWGAWLRDSGAVDLSSWNARDASSYLATVKAITTAQTALAPSAVVADGKTATELGQLAKWNDGKKADKGEFAKLSVPFSEAKPGKIAYAMAYKATLPVATAPSSPSAPAVNVSGSDLTVDWTAPADGGSAITRYEVALNGGAPVIVTGATHHVFTGLAAGKYAVTVRAVNAVGSSEVSAASATVTVVGGTPAPVDPTTVRGTVSVAGSLRPGQTITVSGAGFAPETAGFGVTLHSDPVSLGTVTTDASGAFTLRAVIPAAVDAGAHTVIVTINGVEVATLAVTVFAADPAAAAATTAEGALAVTGSGSQLGVVGLGLSVLIAGAAALVVRRHLSRRDARRRV